MYIMVCVFVCVCVCVCVCVLRENVISDMCVHILYLHIWLTPYFEQ